jgi:hypothetical protein
MTVLSTHPIHSSVLPSLLLMTLNERVQMPTIQPPDSISLLPNSRPFTSPSVCRGDDHSKFPFPDILNPLSNPARPVLNPVSDVFQAIAHSFCSRGLVDGVAEAAARGANDATGCAEEATG